MNKTPSVSMTEGVLRISDVLDGAQFNITARSDGFQLDAGVILVPAIPDDLWIIFSDSIADLFDRFTKIFFLTGFALEHDILAFGEFKDIKPVGDLICIVCCDLNTLNIF